MLLPARARHARVSRARDVPALAIWLLVALGVVLLAAAAVVVGTGSEPGPQPVTAPLASVPGVQPVGLEIPTIEVSAQIKPVGLTADQHMEVPSFGEIGWYHFGPLPGEIGHAVIAGHVDSRSGPDVFGRLHTMRPGDEILVRMSTGSVLSFIVDELGRQPKEDLPDSAMWRFSDRPHLVLITCGGSFDRKHRTYTENLVVYATAA